MNFQNWEILQGLSEKFLASVEMVLVFGKSADRAFFITSDDDVFCIGQNRDGSLGVGQRNVVSFYGLPTKISILSKNGVKGIVCGGDVDATIFSIAYLYSGEIYWWGHFPFNDLTAATPRKISLDHFQIRVKKVACGARHCAVLSEDGQVFTWGQNMVGQLGRSCPIFYCDENNEAVIGDDTPTMVEGIIGNQIVIDISCGFDFSVVLLDDGRVATWGNNDYGQLGLNGKGTISSTPLEVTAFRDYYDTVIGEIVCGRAHVLALSRTGTLYAWGSNYRQQLGLSNIPISKHGCPFEVQVNNLRFTEIGASYLCDISVAKCETRKVYMWGETTQGIIEPTETECESVDQVFASFAKPRIMPKPMKRLESTTNEFNQVEEIEPMAVSETLEKEFNNPDTSDLKIVIDDKEIYVHQGILKMRSDYFNAMITRWLEKDERLSAITMKEKSFTAIEAYLKYLYTDKLEIDLNLAVELLQLADEYSDDMFKSACEKIIRRNMTADAVADVFAFTRKLENCKNLNRFCLDFALHHATEVMSSSGFEAWDMDTMKAFLDAYVKVKGNCR